MVVHVLDRDKGVADAIATMLEAEGTDAVVHETLDSLIEARAVSDKDCVVVCDRFPDLPDLQFAEALSGLPKNLRLIFMTNGRLLPSDPLMAIAGQRYGFVRKPINPAQLMDVITRAQAGIGPGSLPSMTGTSHHSA